MLVQTYLLPALKTEHPSSLIKKPLSVSFCFTVVLNRKGTGEEESGVMGNNPISYFNLFPPEWEVNKDSDMFRKLTYIKIVCM